MRLHVFAVAILISGLLGSSMGVVTPANAANCEFVLGFKALHDLIPQIVGNCVEDEHHNPLNGDGLQATSGANGVTGLLVWRKSDNWTAYTDGARTWINGPYGLEQRLNSQRFCWEGDAVALAKPLAPPTALCHVGTTVTIVAANGATVGQTANVVAATSPNANCALYYWTPRGSLSLGPGTGPRTADSNGEVSWTWTVTVQPPPIGVVVVTCNGAQASVPMGFG